MIRATRCSSGDHGSTAKVEGSGIAIMSDSSTALKPVIEEPSKPIPPVNASSSSEALTANDLRRPRMSVNHIRTNRMSCSATSRLMSSGVLGVSGTGSGLLVRDRIARADARDAGATLRQPR